MKNVQRNDDLAADAPSPSASPSQRFFFRRDWFTLFLTFAVVWLAYYLSLAPEVTLEDSGELATGSFYAGIPHPPGYPVWSVYTWLWTVLVPFGNVAWRVALGEATGGALAAGLLGLIVSRGSSLLIKSVPDLRNLETPWEGRICMVSGFVAGLLLGFNGFMWSQSVIVEVYSVSVASLMLVLVFLLRWLYLPTQRRYLFLALFFHGICFTNHQTLIVAAMGIEVFIAAADFRLGRNLFLGNSIIYLAGLILKQQHILTALEQNPAVLNMFHAVGLLSLLAYGWFAILTKESVAEFCLDAAMAWFYLALAAAPKFGVFALPLALVGLAGWFKFGQDTRKLGREWGTVLLCGLCWVAGAGFYFYMPLSGMTNPPMEWGYPRMVEGFIHAFTRGQYEKMVPSDFIHHPANFGLQLLTLGQGIIEEFNWVYAFLALVPFLFFFRLARRERAWLIGLSAIYFCLGIVLLYMLNPTPDRSSQELNRVFFTASHAIVAMLVGYALALIAATMATRYATFRLWGLAGAVMAVLLAIFSFVTLTSEIFFGESVNVSPSMLFSFVLQCFTNQDQYALPVYAGLILVGLAIAFLAGLLLRPTRAPMPLFLMLFALMPLHSIMTHWADNEQRNHWFGYWYGHDMFTPPFKGADGKPLYPEMTRNAILFGGTDAGRFCPTYMIFCDSFIPHYCQPQEDQHFDRRDVYIITQNALADGTYLCYIRAQYNRSAQIDPPFFQELLRSKEESNKNVSTNLLARLAKPLDTFFLGFGARVEEHRRVDTSFFTEHDFTNLGSLATKLSGAGDPLSKYIYERLGSDTRQLLARFKESPSSAAQVRHRLALDLNRLLQTQLYEPTRFKALPLKTYLAGFLQQHPKPPMRIRLNRLLLESAYPEEIAPSPGGVYPDREIYTPSSLDLQICMQQYMEDAARRLHLNQLEPGEGVTVENGQLKVGGQVSVMHINALLTRIMFDRNPDNDFFVEESYPLQWMYPYLTPFGIIMKVNRQKVAEITQDTIAHDHSFWQQYAERLIGNWIGYDTSVKALTEWAEKIYLRHDFSGFKGDRKFLRDDQAQKCFSKLRGSIGGIYAWRISDPENHDPAVQQRMFKEADFAFAQSYALCPYSIEALARYVNLLTSQRRFDDALMLARTSLKLDPFNLQFQGIVQQLENWKNGANPTQQNIQKYEKLVQAEPDNLQAKFDLAGAYLQAGQSSSALDTLDTILNHPKAEAGAMRVLLQAYSSISNTNKIQQVVHKLDAMLRANPTNYQAAVALAEGYRDLQETNTAAQVLDSLLNNPKADSNAMVQLAQQYAAQGDFSKLDTTLQRLTQLSPESPEAWYDLAAMKATLGKPDETLPLLQRALDLSRNRIKQNPQARDLSAELQKDPRFTSFRQSAQFLQLTNTAR